MPDSHTIAENLTRLTTARTNIATAITTKGGTVATGAGLEDFPTAIGTIPSGGDIGPIIDGTATSLVVPEGVTAIAPYKMYAGSSVQRNLTHLSLPSTITSIGSEAFRGQINITGDLVFPTGTYIGMRAFYGVQSLSPVPTGFNVTLTNPKLISECFRYATIKNLTIVGDVVRDGSQSENASPFYGCYAETVTANDIVTINVYVFSNSSLFSGCERLHSVTMNSLTKLRPAAFSGCSALTTVNLPNVTQVEGYQPYHVFRNCTALQTISLPSWTGAIERGMFSGCTALQTVSVGSATSIELEAFYNCSALTTMEIPAAVTNIASNAFSGCTSLTSIKFLGSTPPTVTNANAWTGVPTTCTIQVPTGSLTAYTTASNYPDPNTYTYVEY